jgi:NAD(P)-dependent dehydrogenase (short-subunit alcohol dehydrogenase family)
MTELHEAPPRANPRWALVAGGSGGIGRAVSQELAQRGWNVALTYRGNKDAGEETAELVRSHGREADLTQVDLADPTSTSAAVAELGERGRLDDLVYAAGPHIPMNFIARHSPQTFSDTIDNDLKGCFNLVHPALPYLRTSRGAVCAVVTPVLRHYTRMDILSAAPKAGIEILVRGVAAEEGRYGVRANCVGAGVLQGEGMWTALMESGDYTEKGLQQALARIPLGRFGHVSDVAKAIGYLLSDDAAWVTGQTLHVDGGYSV